MGDLASILRELRDVRLQLSQSAFGDQLGLEQCTISRYETGDLTPPIGTVLRIYELHGKELRKMGYGRTALIDALARRAG